VIFETQRKKKVAVASPTQVEQVKAENFKFSVEHIFPGYRRSPMLMHHHLLAEKENTTRWKKYNIL
jgi:hypothetical protein